MAQRSVTRRDLLRYAGALAGGGAVAGVPWLVLTQGATAAQLAEELAPLDPRAIPKYENQLPIPRVFAPSVIRNSDGDVIRHDYTVSAGVLRAQVLPPPFPQTTLLGYSGRVIVPGSRRTEFVATSPGPAFENTRGVPSRVTWRNRITVPHMLAVDPHLHWANPNAMEPPEPPFVPFPPGYGAAQAPVPFVTHNHGLIVEPHLDGTAEQWYTAFGHRGPSYVTDTYRMPNEQPSTQLFYHDHTMGITRLNGFAGVVGNAYFIRDPGNPLDGSDSPLPSGEFEIPLAIADRGFFTNGELDFPRESRNPHLPYWEADDFSEVAVVNGKAWPNLDVQRRQYRFRVLAAGNMRVWQLQLQRGGLDGEFLPFTIIGADGGYLPAPHEADRVIMGITERVDMLVDFSPYPPGTEILVRNTLEGEGDDGEREGADPQTIGQIMRFRVVDSEPVPPPAIDPGLFPVRHNLVPDAPTRTKVTVRFEDNRDNPDHITETDRLNTLDGLGFSSPVTELPLVGSTEQWEIVNTKNPDFEDSDNAAHMIHLHLLHFQVQNRQQIDNNRYLQDWFLLNGHRPVSRPIVLDPGPYLIGDPIPPEPQETGWKDTARADARQVTRLLVRWAPTEVPTGEVEPGENRFPVEVEFPSDQDPVTGPGYLWHCHMLNHEDHEMMRPQPLVYSWQPGVGYPAGRIVAYDNVDYRVRVAHTSTTDEPPTARFDLWERVNNNDGSWQPQITYAIEDRILHDGQLYAARRVHQAQPGEIPPDHPELWEPLPMTAKEQLVHFADPDDPIQAPFFEIGVNGTEEQAREILGAALAVCHPIHPMPSSGITEEAVYFEVPDGEQFRPQPTPDSAFYETHSRLHSITVRPLRAGQAVTVNGRQLRSGVNYPLPPQRNHGYLIETTGGAIFTAR